MTLCSQTKLLLTVVRYPGQYIKGTMCSIAPWISDQTMLLYSPTPAWPQ